MIDPQELIALKLIIFMLFTLSIINIIFSVIALYLARENKSKIKVHIHNPLVHNDLAHLQNRYTEFNTAKRL